MSIVKFLTASTECPREASVKELTLPVPQPGMNEYRRYYNHRFVDREESVGEELTVIQVPVADFVAVVSDHTPTQEEWRNTLLSVGYTESQVNVILE